MNRPPGGGVAAQVAATPNGEAPGRNLFYAGALVAFLVGLVTYLLTMAPTTSFWDSGEFIACSYTLGVPHSPGTPLYVLIGRVFTLLPLPLSIAGRVNFMSAFSGALGVLFLYLLVVRFLGHVVGRSVTIADTLLKVGAGLGAALFITFSHTYWINATESEVYAMSVFLMAFMTWLVLKWADNPTGHKSTSLIYLLFYLLALTVGLHLGTVLAFTGIFFFIYMTKKKSFTNAQFLLACFGMSIFIADATLTYGIFRESAGTVTLVALILFAVTLFVVSNQTKSTFAAICTGLFVLGVSVHLYLYFRSIHNPLIDEADPATWRNLYAVLRREQYPPANLFVRKAAFSFQLQHFNNYFQAQFEMASVYLGKLNIGSVIPLALGIWGIVDHYAKHKKTFIMLFVSFLVMSLGMILYLNFSDSEVRERDYFYLPAFYYFAIFIGIGAGSFLAEIKRFVERRGGEARAPVVVGVVLLLVMPVFTARHHWYSHDRSGDVVCQEYSKNMLVGLDENALIFTNGDNDTFPLWYVQEVERYRTDVRVVNLSLLNTPWYIKQLRDNEPKVSIPWTDAQVNQLRPMRTRDGVLLVRDIAVQQILRNNNRSRPIYFAVTIPPEVYAPYRDIMEMEGLAYRVVGKKGTNMINREKLEDNIWKKYGYGGLLDEDWKRDKSTYQPPFVERLIQNYAAAFAQLAFVYVREDDWCVAVRNLEVAQEISPDIGPVREWLGWYYLECGDTIKAIDHYKRNIEEHPEHPQLLYRLAGVYERLLDYPQALSVLEQLVVRDPGHRDAVISASGIAYRLGEAPRAKSFIDRWLSTHPSDDAMRQVWEQIKAQVEPLGASGSSGQ